MDSESGVLHHGRHTVVAPTAFEAVSEYMFEGNFVFVVVVHQEWLRARGIRAVNQSAELRRSVRTRFPCVGPASMPEFEHSGPSWASQGIEWPTL